MQYQTYMSRFDPDLNTSFPIYLPEPLAKITGELQILGSVDFKQNVNQVSLPQTSLIYGGEGYKYLIFIDIFMTLSIYDLSGYLELEDIYWDPKKTLPPNIPLVSTTDLFKATFINQGNRVCTNLVLLDDNELIMNCLATDGIHATQVIIDISDPQQVRGRYFTTKQIFKNLKDGKYVMLKRVNDFSYLMLTKENRTVC